MSRRSRVSVLVAAGLAGVVATSLTAGPAGAAVERSQPAQSHQKELLTVGLTHAARPARPTKASNLTYHGGRVSSKGVKVYIVFWGSQWGTGTTTPSSDPTGAAARQVDFFNHVGGDAWSKSTLQYCDGVATGTVNCGTAGNHTLSPTNVLKGTWVDNTVSAINNASESQIAAEVARAVAHFGNDTSDGVQYVIDFPHGVYPNGFAAQSGGTYCAYHDNTTVNGASVAFTNMPYMTDAGFSCGANFVNAGSAGALDGVTIVGGHEYTETLTDQWPSAQLAWVDSKGAENADKCAWVSSGSGAAGNVALNGKSYALQSLWSNLASGCVLTS